jgi:hypothetical protein
MTDDEMRAREAIRYTLELYNRNADSADYDRHCEVFQADAQMIVQNRSPLKGVEAIVGAMKAGAEKRGASVSGCFQRHNLTTTMIEFTSKSEATVITYILVVTEIGLDHAGRYDDRFVKQGDRWLIARRRATMEWANPQSRFATWLGNAAQVTADAE